MPTSKLVIVGLVAIGALGVTLNSYIRTPWQDPGGTRLHKETASKLGYLSPSELPNSVALLPPPPAPGSAAMLRDERARQAALTVRGTARYSLAADDAVRLHENTVQAFQCALGTDISLKQTPKLYELLSRVRLDVRAASYAAKSRYKRPRPFVVYNTRACYADDEKAVHDDGSYPSARGAVGWAFALVLAKARPDRAEAILKRAQDFAQSRIVCDLEWQSDVEAGRTLAVSTVGRLEANDRFKADFAAARKEVAAEVAAAVRPSRECESERIALAGSQPRQN
jgi:acid phosphatase (class A)